MSSELQDFDLRCRGAYKVAEDWQASPQLRAVWALEDVVALYNEFLPSAIAVYDNYCKTGKLPEKGTIGMVLDHLRGLSIHGKKLIQLAGKKPADTLVATVAELQSNIANAQEILREEDYATDMSFLNFSEN
jgi:hypothetical protein